MELKERVPKNIQNWEKQNWSDWNQACDRTIFNCIIKLRNDVILNNAQKLTFQFKKTVHSNALHKLFI